MRLRTCIHIVRYIVSWENHFFNFWSSAPDYTDFCNNPVSLWYYKNTEFRMFVIKKHIIKMAMYIYWFSRKLLLWIPKHGEKKLNWPLYHWFSKDFFKRYRWIKPGLSLTRRTFKLRHVFLFYFFQDIKLKSCILDLLDEVTLEYLNILIN